jgi:hypothetical protein
MYQHFMTEDIRMYLDIYYRQVVLYIKSRVGLSIALLERNIVSGPLTFIS